MSITKYWLDSKNRIVKTSLSWDNFAEDNEACMSAYSSHVIGKSLFSFISGDTTRMFIESLIQKVRLTNQNFETEYRCDSPDTMRFMRMNIVPLGEGQLMIKNTLVKEAPFKKRAKIQWSETESVARRCSICNQLNHQGTWVDPSEIVFDLDVIPIIHTVCEDCRDMANKKTA